MEVTLHHLTPLIDGVKTISQLSQLSKFCLPIVKKAVQLLLFHNLIFMVDQFHVKSSLISFILFFHSLILGPLAEAGTSVLITKHRKVFFLSLLSFFFSSVFHSFFYPLVLIYSKTRLIDLPIPNFFYLASFSIPISLLVKKYSNRYATTCKIHQIIDNKEMQEGCLSYLFSSNPKALSELKTEKLFGLYCKVSPNLNVRQFIERHKHEKLKGIQFRKFFYFGVVNGLLRRIYTSKEKQEEGVDEEGVAELDEERESLEEVQQNEKERILGEEF